MNTEDRNRHKLNTCNHKLVSHERAIDGLIERNAELHDIIDRLENELNYWKTVDKRFTGL